MSMWLDFRRLLFRSLRRRVHLHRSVEVHRAALHRGDEEQPDELRQMDVDERVDEGDRNQQSDEKRANHREHDRAVDEAHAPAEEIEFRARRLLSLGLELAQPFLECAAAVHGAAQAIGEHSDDRPHRGEQEHRRDRELDESCDVDDVFGVHAGPLLPAAVPYTIPYTIALRSWCLKWWMWLSATFSLPRSFAASASSRFFCHSPILVLIAVLSTPLTSWCTCMSMLSALHSAASKWSLFNCV